MKTTCVESAVVLRAWGVLALAVTAIYLLFYGAAAWVYHNSQWRPLVVPNEQSVAYDVLAAKFSGDRYFHLSRPVDASSIPEVRYLTPVSGIRDQIDGVARARHLDADGLRRLNETIDQLGKPSASRSVRSRMINILQLDLALDQNF